MGRRYRGQTRKSFYTEKLSYDERIRRLNTAIDRHSKVMEYWHQLKPLYDEYEQLSDITDRKISKRESLFSSKRVLKDDVLEKREEIVSRLRSKITSLIPTLPFLGETEIGEKHSIWAGYDFSGAILYFNGTYFHFDKNHQMEALYMWYTRILPSSIRKNIEQIKRDRAIQEIQKSRSKKRAKEKREKELEKKMRFVRNEKGVRNLANQVKSGLSKNHVCPYCSHDLGNSPHADHIYPVSKGGQSRPSNMVMVCQDCNLKKGGMTLTAFIKKHSLDRDGIESILLNLGKEI